LKTSLIAIGKQSSLTPVTTIQAVKARGFYDGNIIEGFEQ
jgi:hypothetical protein